MHTLKRSSKPVQLRVVAGLAFAVALGSTVGCNGVAAPVADPAPPIAAVAGEPFTGVVDTFTDTDPNATAFAGPIDWGDTQTSQGSVTPRETGTGVVYDVSGSNTYAAAGDYTATVDFVDNQSNAAVGTVPVHVSDTPELDSLVLFGTALMGAGGSTLARRWVPLPRGGRRKRSPSSQDGHERIDVDAIAA